MVHCENFSKLAWCQARCANWPCVCYALVFYYFVRLMVLSLNREPHTGRVHTPSLNYAPTPPFSHDHGLGLTLRRGARSNASCEVGRATSLSAASPLNVSEGDKEIMG